MQKGVIGALVALWIAQIAYADGDLRLIGDEVTWLAGEQSGQFTLRVGSTTPDPVVLTAWHLRFTITPESNASGKIFFDSFSTNSLFEIDDSFVDPNPPASPDISDLIVAYATDFDGVTVSSTDVNLLQVGLMATVGATGQFDIAVLPSSTSENGYCGAEWYSGDPDYARTPFEGVPFDNGPVRVGSVSITPIPEPSSVILLLSGAITFAIGRFRRQKGQRQQIHRVGV
jgi:hypothetical protein